MLKRLREHYQLTPFQLFYRCKIFYPYLESTHIQVTCLITNCINFCFVTGNHFIDIEFVNLIKKEF